MYYNYILCTKLAINAIILKSYAAYYEVYMQILHMSVSVMYHSGILL